MKIAIIGATGFIGKVILSEALARGHKVTAIVRHAEKLTPQPNLTIVEGDVVDTAKLSQLLKGNAVVISSFNPGKDESGKGARSIIEAVKQSGVSRLLVVGGAGTLEVAPGKRLVDQPDFPSEWKAGALRTAEVLDQLRKEPELDWTFLSPAAVIEPAERTGKFRLGKDQLLTGNDGESRISVEDYAVAMLDEAENHTHPRQRFTVAY
jgi:putative NADH-flavin reductase